MCYSAADMSRLKSSSALQSQKLADDWHELMIPWSIMQPSIAHSNKQLDPRCSTQTYHNPISALGLHHIARKLLLISHPTEGRRLSGPEHIVASSLLKAACNQPGCILKAKDYDLNLQPDSQ